MMTRCTLAGSLLLGTALAGCSTSPGTKASDEVYSNVSYSYIKSNLTPELQGLSERSIDIDRNMAVTGNQNLRMMWGDLGRAFFFDKPSKLTPFDVVNTTGQPGQ